MALRTKRENRPEWAGEAVSAFCAQERGLQKMIRAADLFTVHLVARIRGDAVDPQQVEAILSGRGISGFAMLDMTYSEDERSTLAEREDLRELGNQVLVATYTLLEAYLINKFGEYLRFVLPESEPDLCAAILRRARLRSLKEIKSAYRDFLGIEIAHYEGEPIYTTPNCSFDPPSSWEAMCTLSDARNKIAHGGMPEYEVKALTDVYYPYAFVRDWVKSFNANFDMLIYDGFETDLIRAYLARREAARSKAG